MAIASLINSTGKVLGWVLVLRHLERIYNCIFPIKRELEQSQQELDGTKQELDGTKQELDVTKQKVRE